MQTIRAIYLTTIDNPFDPSTQWDEWRRFDEDHGYFTSEYLARLAKTSTELSDADYLEAVSIAIDSICDLNSIGLYKKVVIYAPDQKSNEDQPDKETGEGG